MSTMIVGHNQQKEKLDTIMEAVHQASIVESESKISFEKKVNRFLDQINERKSILKIHAERIEGLFEKIDEITWFRDVDGDILIQIRSLITNMEKLSRTMIITYSETNRVFTKHGIDKKELKHFKIVADDLKELATDMNEIFFILPNNKEYQKLCNELNAL